MPPTLPVAQAFVLLFYMWNPDMRSSNPVTAAEFSSQQRCEEAGRSASDKFGGMMSKPIFLCVPK